MSEHEQFRLPYPPVGCIGLLDQLDAAWAEAEAAHGPDVARWPPTLLARLNRDSLRLTLMGQANEQICLDWRDRHDGFPPPDVT